MTLLLQPELCLLQNTVRGLLHLCRQLSRLHHQFVLRNIDNDNIITFECYNNLYLHFSRGTKNNRLIIHEIMFNFTSQQFYRHTMFIHHSISYYIIISFCLNRNMLIFLLLLLSKLEYTLVFLPRLRTRTMTCKSWCLPLIIPFFLRFLQSSSWAGCIP